jgi:hypothetical protein
MTVGGLSWELFAGDPRAIRLYGTEVLRGLSYPVRDEDWGTFATATESERREEGAESMHYEHRFRETGGAFDGVFMIEANTNTTGAEIVASVRYAFRSDMGICRAGFTLLHPIKGVTGNEMTLRLANGQTARSHFPERIAAIPPAVDYIGMSHRAGPVEIEIAFEGESFEMEDQRNFSDASFKTFCRPLAKPHPFRVSAGEQISQRVTLRMTLPAAAADAVAPTAAPASVRGRLPVIAWAVDLGAGTPPADGLPVLLRLRVDAEATALAPYAGRAGVTLEIVLPEGDDGTASLAALASRCRAAGLDPARVVALPEPYLKCFPVTPDWPSRPSLEDVTVPLRAAFPAAAVGGGSLTFFNEFNCQRPRSELVDFVTFGNTAIIHAADEASVMQTIEALEHVFDSASALAEGRPLHLGLIAIGVRSNPYGRDVLPNPDNVRMPMVRKDPRQFTEFAAAYAVGVLAVAARSGVASLALAMPDGDLGVQGPQGLSPLGQLIRFAAALADSEVEIAQSPEGAWILRGTGRSIAANPGSSPVPLPPPAGPGWRRLGSGDAAGGLSELAAYSVAVSG